MEWVAKLEVDYGRVNNRIELQVDAETEEETSEQRAVV